MNGNESQSSERMASQPAATEAVWSQLSGDLRRYLRRRVTDDWLADDLLQETFLKIHGALGTLRHRGRLAPWVYGIARNVVRDHYRHRAREAATATATKLAAEADDDGPEFVNPQASLWLHAFIENLPPTYREAVRLAEIDGLRQQEVADRLGISLSGAKSRVQRGRAMLRAALDQCCHFELDRRGNVIDYHPRGDCACGEDGDAGCDPRNATC